jgi:hypothetical protein
LNFGTLAGLWPWAIGPSLKIQVLGFFIITMKFLIQKHNQAGLGSRPQAQMTMGPILKTFLVLIPFEGALTCSILIAGTQVMLRKAYFLRRGLLVKARILDF